MGPYLSLSICKAGGGLHLRPADWGWPRPLDTLRRRHQSLQMQAYPRSHDGLGTGQARLAGPERGGDRREEKPPWLGGRSGPSTQRKISWESECISLSGGRHRSALRPQSWGAGCPGRDKEPAPGLTIPGDVPGAHQGSYPGWFPVGSTDLPPFTRPSRPGGEFPARDTDLSPLGLAILVGEGVLRDSTNSGLAQPSQGFHRANKGPREAGRPGGAPGGNSMEPRRSRLLGDGKKGRGRETGLGETPPR